MGIITSNLPGWKTNISPLKCKPSTIMSHIIPKRALQYNAMANKVCGLSSGGRATIVLDELEKSGFIQQTIPYAKITKDAIYRLIDEFSGASGIFAVMRL